VASPQCTIRLLFFAIRFTHGIVALLHSAGGTHTHGISAKLGHFTCAPTRFHEVHRFHSFQFARISFSLYGSTNQVLFSGWDSQSHEVEGKKGGRCTAFATRHEEQLSQKEETTILYTPFSLMLEVQTSPMERVKSLGFFIMFQFWIPRFFVLFFFCSYPLSFGLPFPGKFSLLVQSIVSY
jgi:hypothetical protein